MKTLSFMLFSRNNPEQVLGLVRDIYDIADEIVLVDSSDRAGRERLHAEKKKRRLNKLRIYYVVPLGFVETVRSYALTKCKGDWVCYLDADERISQDLKREIKKIIDTTHHQAFTIKRFEEVHANGDTSSYFTWQTRLFQRGRVHYKGIVDERPAIRGSTAKLNSEKYYIKHMTELMSHHMNEYYKPMNKFAKYELLSYEEYNARMLEFLARYKGIEADQARRTLQGRLLLRLLHFYEAVMIRHPKQEINTFDYFMLWEIKHIGRWLSSGRFDARALYHIYKKAMEYHQYKKEPDHREAFEISKLVNSQGFVDLLGLDEEETIRKLNEQYADNKELQGLGLLIHLLTKRYKELYGGERLLFVTNSVYSFGGGEKWTLELAMRLRGTFSVKIADMLTKRSGVKKTKSDISAQYGIDQSRIIDIPCHGKSSVAFQSNDYTTMIPTLMGLRTLHRLIKESDAVYQVSYNPFIFFAVLVFTKLHGKRMIMGVHSPVFSKMFDKRQSLIMRVKSKVYLSLLSTVRYFHVLTAEDARLVERAAPKARVFTVPIFATDVPERIRGNGKEFITLFVGRLQRHQKGIDLLEEITDKVLSSSKNVKFHVLGSGGDGESTVAALSRRYPENFKWLGFTKESTLKAEYDNSSLFISTSRYEGMPAVLLEAQLHGLPAVVFDIKGAREIVSYGATADLVKPFKTDEFAEKVLAHSSAWEHNKNAYLKKKEEIAETQLQRYSADKIIPRMKEMFKEALD